MTLKKPNPRKDNELEDLESDWALWLYSLFPSYINKPMAQFHVDFWDWAWKIRPLIRPQPHLNVWFRSAGKSTHAELFAIALGARKIRGYGVYIKESQDRADDAVANISTMLESRLFGAFYPEMSNRALSRYGKAKGWRRNRLHTASGFVIDALGLDVASRGLKVDEKRPDLAILDDIDTDTDTSDIIEKKISTLTRRILPALHPHAAILGIQNLVHSESIFSQLVNGTAGFLSDAAISGPFPALIDMSYETRTDKGGRPRIVVTGGEPTWPPVDIAACQEQIDTIGITAFLSEMQHLTPEMTGGMFDHVTYRHCISDDVPNLDKVAAWVDPAVTDKDDSDAMGIQIDGIARDGVLYRLWSWEKRGSPLEAIRLAIKMTLEFSGTYVGIETDQGGDTWRSVFNEAKASLGAQYAHITMRAAKAGAGLGNKRARASQMLADYERGMIIHVEGTHHILEAALNRFPATKPFDLVDAAAWSHRDLRRLGRPAKATAATGTFGMSGHPAGRGRGASLGVPGSNLTNPSRPRLHVVRK